MVKLVHITTVPDSLIFIEGQISYMKSRGFDVSVITSPGEKLEAFRTRTNIRSYGIEMPRAITPLQDIKSVTEISNALFEIEPDIVHAHTPKGGLLGMMAASAAMVPHRVYQMRGLLTFTAQGRRREMFRRAEQLSCRLAHKVICQSHSLRREALSEKMVHANKSTVLLNGSNGVDAIGKFNPKNSFANIRKELGIKPQEKVIGFVGRMVKDKGIEELIRAWEVVSKKEKAKLILVGPIEERDAVDKGIIKSIKSSNDIHWVDFTRDTPSYYNAFDFLVLPTYREGFPNVPLEAAAMGIPTIATNVPGCIDAVVHQHTGILVPAKDSVRLADAMLRYLRNDGLRKKHGQQARARVLEFFQPEKIWEENYKLYLNMLK